MMTGFHRFICTGLGIGYIGKGAGTIAAMVCCFCWWLLKAGDRGYLISIIVTSLILVAGIWSAGKVETAWGKDNQRIVIDEVVGMCISLLWIPVQLPYLITAFLLFRFFDIVKPLFIRKVENLPGGWGVMFDDVLAGIYANLLLQLIIATNFLSNVHIY